MKICFITTNFPRYIGDSEGTFIWEAARAVANQGHQVRVIAQHWAGYPTYEWMENVEVIRPRYWFPENKEILRHPGGGIPIIWKDSFLAKVQMLAFIFVQTLTVIRFSRGFDVIHTQWTLSAGIAILSRAVHRRPILATLQGSDLFQVPRSKTGKILTKWVLMYTQQITVLSRALLNEALNIGVSLDKIKVIPNGVDINKFSPSKRRDNVILYVGSLIKRKGVNYLIEAFAMLADIYPEYSLVIVGDGVDSVALRTDVQKRALSSKVIFTGSLPPDLVRDWMQHAQVFVLPSIEEGLGVVLLEALACGTPIVASAVGGIVDVVSDDVGYLVSPANPEELKRSIEILIQDANIWEKMSKNARNKAVREYDWKKIANQFSVIYQKMLDMAGK